jgi:hypothetical protein
MLDWSAGACGSDDEQLVFLAMNGPMCATNYQNVTHQPGLGRCIGRIAERLGHPL